MAETYEGRIIPGTTGSNDWTYIGSNPFIWSNEEISLSGTKAMGLSLLNPTHNIESGQGFDKFGPYRNNYNYWKEKIGSGENLTTYKTALYLYNNDGPDPEVGVNGTVYVLLQNIRGEVRNSSFINLTFQDWNANNDGTYYQENGMHNVKDPNELYYGVDFMISPSIPYFTDLDAVNAYLLSDDTDPTNYNGKFKGSKPTPKKDPEKSDNIVHPGEVPAITDSKLFTICNIEGVNIDALSNIISGGWTRGNVAEGIVSYKIIRTPGGLNWGSEETLITNSTHSINVLGRKLTTDSSGKTSKVFDMGTYDFEEVFQSYLDYAGYTKIKIYLPFSGVYDLDPNLVQGGKMTLKAWIDPISGNVVYRALINVDGTEFEAYNWNGNCSMDLPITSADYGRKVSQYLSMAGSVAGGLAGAAIGGPAGAAAGVGVVSSVTLQGAHAVADNGYINTGSISSNNGFITIPYPYIIISRPKRKTISNYGHNYGYPCMQNLSFGSLSGFTIVDTVHLENIPGATSDELSEIDTLLKSGVIF